MLVLTDGGRERAALVAVDVATDARPMYPEVLAEREDAELERFALTEDGALAALVWNVAGRSELDLLDLATGKPAALHPARRRRHLRGVQPRRRLARHGHPVPGRARRGVVPRAVLADARR